LSEQFEGLSFINTLFDEIGQSTIGTEFHENVNTVIHFLKAVVTHDVGMNQRRQTLKSIDLPFVSLALHSFDSNNAFPFGGVSSEDLSKGSLTENAIRIEIEVVG